MRQFVWKKFNVFNRQHLTEEMIHHSLHDIVSADRVAGLHIDEGAVQFSIKVDPDAGSAMEDLRQKSWKCCSSS